MIVQEWYDSNLVRTYSDQGFKILQTETGIVYCDAVDVRPVRFTYIETEERVEE